MASSFSCSSSGGRYVANTPVALVASPVATASSFSVTATAAAVKQHLKHTHTKQQHSNKSSTPPSEPSQIKPASRVCCSSGGGCSGCCSWRIIAPPPASTPTITTTSTTTTTASPPSSPSPSFGVCHRWLKAKGGHTGCGEQD